MKYFLCRFYRETVPIVIGMKREMFPAQPANEISAERQCISQWNHITIHPIVRIEPVGFNINK
jgi:hypothetical protein